MDSSQRAIHAELSGQEVLLIAGSSEELVDDWDHSGGCAQDERSAQTLQRHAAAAAIRRWRGHGER